MPGKSQVRKPRFILPGFRPEDTRKVIHIFVGVFFALLPIWLSWDQILLAAILLVPLTAISKQFDWFESIHGVKRLTWGEIYFPAGIAITVYFVPQIVPYVFAVLVLGISDGLASLVGQNLARRKYKIGGWQKSYLGSFVFLISTFSIGLISLIGAGHTAGSSVIPSLLMAAILMAVEAASGYGLDNLFLTPIAALLIARLV